MDQPITWKSRSDYFPCATSVEDGSLILSGAQDSPYYYNNDRYSLGLLQAQMDGKNVNSEDASVQTVVRVNDEFAFAGLYTRGQTQENGGDGGAYFGNIRGDGLITTGSFTGQALTLETPLDPVNTDVVLRVDTVNDSTGGARVITTAWAADNPAEKYSITFVDSLARTAGFMGQSFGRGGDDATGASTTFRSFEVAEAVAPPTLRIERAVVLSWPMDAEGYALMGADSVNGPWVEIDAEVTVTGNESTVALRADEQMKFYQLLAPWSRHGLGLEIPARKMHSPVLQLTELDSRGLSEMSPLWPS